MKDLIVSNQTYVHILFIRLCLTNLQLIDLDTELSTSGL